MIYLVVGRLRLGELLSPRCPREKDGEMWVSFLVKEKVEIIEMEENCIKY